jgi:hypothetical protein
MPQRRKAKEVADFRPNQSIWIDHALLGPQDDEWMTDVERLTLWNVEAPPGLLSRLGRLWWVDLRGGSAADLGVLAGCDRLRFLAVNQIRGMTDLSLLPNFERLEMLRLYGLPRVEQLPSLAGLEELRRIEIGSMKGLKNLTGLLDAPNLQELLFMKAVGVTAEDIERVAHHRSLKAFTWVAEDVPDRIWVPVVKRLGLPAARILYPEEWFNRPKSGTGAR